MTQVYEEAFFYNVGYKHPLVDVSPDDLKISRLDLFEYLLPNRKNYLEIGCDHDHCFSLMKPKFEIAIGVDPNRGGTHKMTSDYYFRTSDIPTFDLIFIDGLHNYEQVIKDIKNSLKHISKDGIIVCHDCKPRKESEACPIRPIPHTTWNGDVWKAALWSRLQSEIDCAVLNVDWGLLVITQRQNTDPILLTTLEKYHCSSEMEILDKVKWDDYVEHQKKWLRPMSFKDIKVWLKEEAIKDDCIYEKVDNGSPSRILIVTDNKDFLRKLYEMPYGSYWVYEKCDIQKTIAKHNINVVWSDSSPLSECYWVHFSQIPFDLSPKDLAVLAEKSYFNETLRPTLESFKVAYSGNFSSVRLFNPLISLFSSTYRSKGRVKRTFKSLQMQTYKNWEWVVLFDSDIHSKIDLGDMELFDEFCQVDGRVKVFFTHRHNGSIGEMKHKAIGLCCGDVVVELDHDDELTPDCLELTAKAFELPLCPVFIYSTCCEPNEIDVRKYPLYSIPYSRGYGGYRREKYQGLDWIFVNTPSHVNSYSASHIVGVPNHFRAWRRDFYCFIGGHSHLWVGDDYELILRTYLTAPSKIVSIPLMLYVQYRNLPEQSLNNTFSRNAAIQRMVGYTYNIYSKEIDKVLPSPRNLIPDAKIFYPWAINPKDFVFKETIYREDKIAYLFICGEDKDVCLTMINEKIEDKPYELLVAGIDNSWLNDVVMSSIISGSVIIRWWNYNKMEIARKEEDFDHKDINHVISVKSQAIWSLVSISKKVYIFIPEENKEEVYTF